MLSNEAPALCREILEYPGGIHCIRLTGEGTPRIILKLPVSFLLPAKINQGFKIYVVPAELFGRASLGLMCAFFDDNDSPLVSWRLLDDRGDTQDLLHTFARSEILVHLFDEQGRELLGYRATIDVPLMAKVRLEHAKFPEPSHESFHAAHEQAMIWFGLRTPSDDEEAIQINFLEPLFPEDLAVVDMRPDLYLFHGGEGHGLTMLERPEPGKYQELDIIQLLQRLFRPDQIYHAPKRHYDKEEIADVLVISDHLCLIVQAKDSPNTQETMNRTLERKRLTSMKQLNDALKQVAGAVGYLRRTRPLRMFVNESEIEIDLGKRNVISLAVVRELFLDEYDHYSKALFDSFEQTGQPCIVLDYQELHAYTTYCDGEDGFLRAYFQVFDTAREIGSFPRLRFGIEDVKALWKRQERDKSES